MQAHHESLETSPSSQRGWQASSRLSLPITSLQADPLTKCLQLDRVKPPTTMAVGGTETSQTQNTCFLFSSANHCGMLRRIISNQSFQSSTGNHQVLKCHREEEWLAGNEANNTMSPELWRLQPEKTRVIVVKSLQQSSLSGFQCTH